MKLWEAFMPYILPECPGLTEMLAEQQVKQTAREFFTKSRVIVERLDPVILAAGQRTYDLYSESTKMNVIQVQGVWLNSDRRLVETTLDDLAMRDWHTQQGEPTHYVVEQLGTVSLYKTPQTSGGVLTISAVLAPSMSSLGISDSLFERHAIHIAVGTKAALMAMPGMSWTNPPLSQYYQSLYARDLNETRIDGKRQYGRANQSVKLRSF